MATTLVDTRRVAPWAYLKSMTRRASIDKTADLSRMPVLTRCLHLHTFFAPTISLMMDESDDDEDDDLIVFDTLDDLYERCDFVMDSVKDDSTNLVQDGSFDYCGALGAGHVDPKWLEDHSIHALVEKTSDLSLYDEVNLIHPRASRRGQQTDEGRYSAAHGRRVKHGRLAGDRPSGLFLSGRECGG